VFHLSTMIYVLTPWWRAIVLAHPAYRRDCLLSWIDSFIACVYFCLEFISCRASNIGSQTSIFTSFMSNLTNILYILLYAPIARLQAVNILPPRQTPFHGDYLGNKARVEECFLLVGLWQPTQEYTTLQQKRGCCQANAFPMQQWRGQWVVKGDEKGTYCPGT
jgi:hypothetical protein